MQSQRKKGAVNTPGLTNFDYSLEQQVVPTRRTKRARRVGGSAHYVTHSLKYKVLDQPITGRLDWGKVEWVLFASQEELFCPICIEPALDTLNPVITSCGHVFCQLCYLQHACLSKNKDKCPVCTTTVTSHFLKPVTLQVLPVYQPGQQISFSLVTRQKGASTRVMLRQKVSSEQNDPFNQYHLTDGPSLALLYQSYLDAMTAFSSTPDAAPIDEFVQEALLLLTQKHSLYSSMKSIRRGTQVPPKGECFDFYQQQDGLHIYLDPLNYRYMLKQYHDDPSSMPALLKAQVLTISNMTHSPEISSRYKFLGHLGANVGFQFMTVQLDDYLTEPVLSQFKEELAQQQRRREEAMKRQE